MPRLTAKERAQLPDTAFAYVDSNGQRRLPIHDEAHVRTALSRFNQVVFEDDAARQRARKRLLTAAKKHGIVPIGFITGQLASERLEGETRGRDAVARDLPTGQVTFLLADIEDSTGLLRLVGDGYPSLLGDVRRILRGAVRRAGGLEVDARADELFAVFKQPVGAVEAAIASHRRLEGHAWPDGATVRVRIGLHTGRPTLTESGYVGLAVHTAARVCAFGGGGQIVLSSATARVLESALPAGARLRGLGAQRLPGLPEPVTLFRLESGAG
ncbi:MAG TPA: adenylate/guanylate cyclase domain-containing protein [Gaiellaceae bacterium]|nr:adenylate/guanylate cyclase domain-containing protein [Gaiellaceae bacterium]